MTGQNTQEDAEGRWKYGDEEVTPYFSVAPPLTDKDNNYMQLLYCNYMQLYVIICHNKLSIRKFQNVHA